MKEIDNSQIKPMLLDIMADVDKFCSSNNIRYYLISGTLLGSIRHDGFIPWDDDIDIWMPRPDYDRFLKEYTHPYYKVISSSTDKAYPLDYAKVHDDRTIIKERGGDGNWGISIDIFPLDGFPTEKAGRALFEKTKRLRRLVANQRFTRKGTIQASNGMVKNISIAVGRIVHPFISFNKLMLKMDRLMKSYDYESSPYCSCLCWRCLIFSKKMLGNKTHRFENKEFRIPEDYDSVLKIIFGDYMTLPPEEKRTSLHGTVAYWKD